jgi:iron complex outermembrane receptor protein
MSEFMNATVHGRNIRRNLLASVSASVLLVSIGCIGKADAASDESGQPTVWIELGGQLEQFGSTEEPFSSPFLLKPRPAFEAVNPLDVEKPPRYAVGGEAKVTFEPAGTDWVFSAAVRYGRSTGHKAVTQQTVYPTLGGPAGIIPYFDNYATTKVTHDESHAVVDFKVGKDVGLGIFGRDSISIFSLGVRYAQFASMTSVNVRERPDLHVNSNPYIKYFHSYGLTGHSARNFRGAGPSLSWEGSIPFAGKPETTEFTLDLGVNGAILFGRQKAFINHHTSGRYVEVLFSHQAIPYENSAPPRNSAHSVTVPNLGGLAGVSVKFPNAKVSLGYRADFFFGAVDGGIDARVTKTLGFNGPFATLSIGLGG